MDQIIIPILSLSSIYITQQKNESIKKYACLLGMMSQPFWFYSFYHAQQWGSFVTAIGFTFVWGLGIYNYWIKDA